MLEGVDLDQRANVLWWPDQAPGGGFQRGRGSHPFETLRAALIFVLDLTETERGTAHVTFSSAPFNLSRTRGTGKVRGPESDPRISAE